MAEEQNTETENTPQAKQQDWTDRIEVRGNNATSATTSGEGDSKILNQEEIDTLFGYTPDQDTEGYTLKTGVQAILNSSMVSYERLPMLDIVFDRLIRMMATSLRNFTQDNVEATKHRGDGIEAAVKEICPGMEIVARQAGDNPESGMRIIESVLQQHPDLNLVIGSNDSGGIGGYQAMVANNAVGPDRAVFSGDATRECLSLMQEPDSIYRGTVDLYPYKGGYEATKYLYEMVQNGIPAEQVKTQLPYVPVPQADLLSGKYKASY